MAASKPVYQARLTNSEIRRQTDVLLSVAVSVRLDAARLKQLLEEHQKDVGNATTPSHGPAAVNASGNLETEDWNEFQYISARIQCPDFLDCEQQAPQARTNDPLIWDWPLAAKKWDQTRTGFITITFFGDQDASGKFALSIAAMPPLQVQVSVFRDLTAWEEIIKKISDILSNVKAILLTLAAIAGILVGWRAKIWKWISKP